MRRVVLAAFGSFGDLHPMIGIAQALKARGARPLIVSHPDYRTKVEAAGVDFTGAGPLFADLQGSEGLTAAAAIDRMARDQAFLYRNIVTPSVEAWIGDITPFIAECDVVVGTALTYAADIVAQLAGKPFVTAALSPAVLLSAHDPLKMPGAPLILQPKSALSRSYNRAILAAGHAMMARALTGVNAAYRRHGLKPRATVTGVTSDRLTLALYSPLLMGPQPDNPPNTQITGFPFFDSETGGPAHLDPRLAAFLEAGSPPLVFSLGSVVVHDGEAFYRAAITAASALNERCVVLCGPESPLLGLDFGPDVCLSAYAPHSLLFPRARAVIHHGGIGSTGQALRAGRPQLVTPVFADQFDNGWRCERIGVARTLDYKNWTAVRATRSLERLLASPAMAQKAKNVAAQVALETGADIAAEFLLRV